MLVRHPSIELIARGIRTRLSAPITRSLRPAQPVSHLLASIVQPCASARAWRSAKLFTRCSAAELRVCRPGGTCTRAPPVPAITLAVRPVHPIPKTAVRTWCEEGVHLLYPLSYRPRPGGFRTRDPITFTLRPARPKTLTLLDIPASAARSCDDERRFGALTRLSYGPCGPAGFEPATSSVTGITFHLRPARPMILVKLRSRLVQF